MTKEQRTTPGEHGHLTMADRDTCPVCNPFSKTVNTDAVCKHFTAIAGVGVTQGTASAEPWNCPWCEIERLQLEFRLSSQQAAALRDDRDRLRAMLERISRFPDQGLDGANASYMRSYAKEALSDSTPVETIARPTIKPYRHGEMEDPVELANRILDRPMCDPDDDLSVMARQFIRRAEFAQAWHGLCENIATMLGVNCALGLKEMGAEVGAAIATLQRHYRPDSSPLEPNSLNSDKARLDWLTEVLVDTIYLDDGRIIDVGGHRERPHDIRAVLDEAMRTLPVSIDEEESSKEEPSPLEPTREQPVKGTPPLDREEVNAIALECARTSRVVRDPK